MDINQKLQSKYPNLDISVLNLSYVKGFSKDFRIDSEPFKKANLSMDNFAYKTINDICIINPAKSEISSIDKNTEITFLSMQNLGLGIIDNREKGTIYEFIKGYTYFSENDILIAKITPCMEHGKCAIATGLKNNIGFGSTEFNVFRIADKNFLKEYIFVFLNRENIRKMASDHMVGTSGRQRVPTEFYKNLKIPILPMEFQLEIEKLVKNSYKNLEQSKALYKEAENLLYGEFGLNLQNGKICIENKSNISIRSLKDSFLSTGRLDAEYYQSKFDDIEKLIKNYKGGCFSLDDTEIKDKNFTPKDDEIYKYIELSNISNNGNINEPEPQKGKYLPSRARRLVKNGNLIISSIEGSLSSCALITKEFDNCIVSTGFYVINSDKINSQTLLVLFKSDFFQNYLLKFPSGTILTAISKDELKNILIPKFPLKTQESIARNLQESFRLRNEAKILLDQAKQSVENAIIARGGG